MAAIATPPPGLHLRLARIDDAAAVARLIEVLGYPCDEAEAMQRMQIINRNPRQALVVAELGERVVGLVGVDLMFYLPIGRETCRITALVVDPEVQNRRIGHALLRYAEAIARQDGAARVELTAASQRAAAHRFYRSCGYTEQSLRFVKNLSDA